MTTDERGAGTVLVVGVCMALASVAWGAAVAVAWFAQARQAGGAADLVAHAGAAAMAEGLDACNGASRAAERNAVALVGCEVRTNGGGFIVEVIVAAPLHPLVPTGPSEVRRMAAAGSA